MWSEIFASLSASTFVVLWVGGFVGGIASGAAGFAFGLAASAIWLHAIAPVHVAVLVVGGGLAMQSTTIWTLRPSLDAQRLWPFVLAGGARGPGGGWVLGCPHFALLRGSSRAFFA